MIVRGLKSVKLGLTLVLSGLDFNPRLEIDLKDTNNMV